MSVYDDSFDDECSEVWEKNYSVKSASLESLSCDSSDSLPHQLLCAMNPSVLSRLKRTFRKGRGNLNNDLNRKVESVMRAAAAGQGVQFAETEPRDEDTLWIDEGTFVHSLENIFGHHKYTTHAHQLFHQLDPFATGQVSWGTLVQKMVDVGARKTWSRRERWQQVEEEAVVIRQLKHCKRETIVKLVCIETDDSFCYAAVSRGGRVGVYSGEFQLLHTYELWYHRSGLKKRVKNAWVTDAIYLSDVQYILITASDRSLTFYDASILTHTPVFCITGMPNIPTCACYRPSPHPDAPSVLTVGDERGELTTLVFTRPRVALLHKDFADKINCYFWRELSAPPHALYVQHSRARVLARAARRVQCARAGVVVTCGLCEDSVVVRGGVVGYVYRVPRGVTCFQVVPALSLLVTGSPDGLVRLWEICQPSEPTAVLQTSGRTAVLDVAIVVDLEIVVALCKNCWVDIWDLYEECLLQTIRIKFPFLGVLGKKVEFGSYCIHPGPALASPPVSPGRRRLGIRDDENEAMDSHTSSFSHPTLVLTCCDYTALLPLTTPRRTRPPPSDTRQVKRPREWDLDRLNSLLAPSPAPCTSPLPPPKSYTPSPPDIPPSPPDVPPSPPDVPPSPPDVPPSPPPDVTLPAMEDCSEELEQLLENAGLQGILEKDFVLMMGLKHDLNQKLSELGNNMTKMSGPVSAGAPYLALTLHEPLKMEPVDEMTERYREVVSLFPPPSVTASSPRSQRSDSTTDRSVRSTRSSKGSRF